MKYYKLEKDLICIFKVDKELDRYLYWEPRLSFHWYRASISWQSRSRRYGPIIEVSIKYMKLHYPELLIDETE